MSTNNNCENTKSKNTDKDQKNIIYSKIFNHNTTSKEAVPDVDRFIALHTAGESGDNTHSVRWIWSIGLGIVVIIISLCLGYRAWNYVVKVVNTFILEQSGVEMQLEEPEALQMNMNSFANKAYNGLDYGKKEPVPYYYQYYASWSDLPFVKDEWEPVLEDSSLRITNYKLEVSEWDKIGKLNISIQYDKPQKSNPEKYELCGYFKIAEYTPDDVILANKGDLATFIYEGENEQQAYFIRNWLRHTYTVYFVIDNIFFEMEIKASDYAVENAKQIIDAIIN